MEIFLTLLLKLIPLYIIILLGFIAGKFLHVKKESISAIVIYIVVPVVIFNGVYTSPINLNTLSLPLLIFSICCLICLLFLSIGKFVWKEKTANLLAFSAGDANTGYFGIPVAIALFTTHLVSIYTVAILGQVLYQNTLGFFIGARGRHTASEALIRLIKLPNIYAFFLAVFFNTSHIALGPIYKGMAISFQGAFVVLGMMMIGLSLSDIKKIEFDFKFLGLSFLAKFIVWPVAILGLFFINSFFGNFYSHDIFKILFLLSIVPMSGNLVAFASQLDIHPEKAAIAVFSSTVIALFYIPLMVTLFIK